MSTLSREALFSELDFHRDCYTLNPQSVDPQETFLLPPSAENKKVRLFCSCTKKSYAQCRHAKTLLEYYDSFIKGYPQDSPTKSFEKSFIWKVIEPVTKFQSNSVFSIKLLTKETLTVCDKQNNQLFLFDADAAQRQRLCSRISAEPMSRFTLMNKAAEFVLSENERQLLNAGHKTQRQITEESVWYRLAYHCYRDFDCTALNISYRICNISGTFFIVISFPENAILQFAVPHNAVPAVFEVLQKAFPELVKSWLHNEDKDLLFDISEQAEKIVIKPVIRFDKTIKEIKSSLIYGSLFYIKEKAIFIRLNHPSVRLLAIGWHNKSLIDSTEISEYLQKNEASFSFEKAVPADKPSLTLDLFSSAQASGFDRIISPQIITSFDHLDLDIIKIEETLCTMNVCYCKGASSISLSLLLDARKQKQRFVVTKDAIIDLGSDEIKKALVSVKGIKDGTITITKAALLQFKGTALKTRISGEKNLVSKLNQMLEFKPVKEFIPLNHLNCTLREYQKAAVQWLLFIYDNNFGALLCDEMGLGKTIQILTFLLAIKEQRDSNSIFLIVCPTSVMSHWKNLCTKFTPPLRLMEYYSAERSSVLKGNYDILLTSYGILRNDIEILKTELFNVAVFDEIHSLKNSDTSGYKAASQITAQVMIGLTGTPIENNLGDLKTLFNLTLPGLFQNDYSADEEVLATIDGCSRTYTRQLQKLISPFMMRRLKSAVLSELPQKIEDCRQCPLSDEQLNLYSAAVNEKGKEFIEILKSNDKPVPYMHIFSLLSFLKQICNHPALALGKPQEYESYASGKWDLFVELLEESLSSGQKVVVFTQYVGMVDIFKSYLEKNNIGHVVLTGSSRQRDKLIKTFSEDESCRVFVGSLKAGGVGIDLVAGSVLIHYDRWWNAAREDQATDRVHRIGQKRVVQIFKLITENTIEERIADIIDKKRNLSNSVLIEDSPDTLKNFSRQELLELLS